MKLVFLTLMILLSPLAQAELIETKTNPLKPLWEGGLFLAGAYIQEYPTSKEYDSRFIGAPIVYYRGKIFRSDEEESVRARFFARRKFDMDISFGASFPLNSNDNETRRGMDNIPWIFEVGPRVNYWFIRNDDTELRLGLPLRAHLGTDFTRVDAKGFSFSPTLYYELSNLFANKSRTYFRATFEWFDNAIAELYFQVDSEFATPSRPVHFEKGGYLGESFSIAHFFDFQTWDIFFSLNANHYGNSEFKDSPLFGREWTTGAIVGLAIDLYESKARGYD